MRFVRKQQGFSLFEIVFVIVFLGLIGATVAVVLNQGVNIFASLSEQQLAASEAQYAMDRMVKELRLLGSGDITDSQPTRVDFNGTYFQSNGSPTLLYRGADALTTNTVSSFNLTYYQSDGTTTGVEANIRKIKIELDMQMPLSGKVVSLREEVFLRDFYYENFQ